MGLRIAAAAEDRMPASLLTVVAAQQFTPEMAADLAKTNLAIFVDASTADEPGAIRVTSVSIRSETPDSHRLDPPALLSLVQQLCGHAPARAFVLTIGAGSFDYGENISPALRTAVPKAVRLIRNLIEAFD